MVQIYSGNTGNRRPAGPFTGLLFAIIGLCMLGGGVYFGMKTQDLLANGLHAQGQVVDIVQKMSTGSSSRRSASLPHLVYYPVVKFEDKQHKAVQFQSNMGSSTPPHNKGDTVDVIYMENDPQGSAIINEGAKNWLVPGIFGGLGAIFTLVGVFTFLRALVV